ncbi:hypothetical protein [Flavobacterium segetis]|nr:hypothetical protein [Flavobacterium segetis]
MIVLDDQGYADFSPFKNYDATILMLNISRLGRAGTIFTQAY